MLKNIPILLAAILLYSCGLFARGVEERAADYYSFQVGYSPKAKYSAFLSPAYRAIADKAALAQLDKGMRATTSPSQRYERIKPEQVTVQQDGIFALTTVDPALGGTFRDGKPVRWVRAGRKWYIYLGSDAEVEKYGQFPPNLTNQVLNTHRPSSAPSMLAPSAAPKPPATGAQKDPSAAAGAAQADPGAAGDTPAPPEEGAGNGEDGGGAGGLDGAA